MPTPGGSSPSAAAPASKFALARSVGPATAIVGLDHSPALINTALQLTAEEGLADRVTYHVGDAHDTPYGDDEFDIVTLHTVVSHVEDPLGVLREARHVVRPGGTSRSSMATTPH